MSRRRTVLLVDDDPGTRHMLQYGLSKAMAPVDVVVATSGREAIAIIESRTVDVVVTDLAMPVGDAFSLIAYLNNARTAIPIVALSSLVSEEADATFVTMAGLRVVRKPVNSRDVAAAAADAVTGRIAASVENIPLRGLLRLVGAERRSCTIVVTSGRRTGRLHVDAGRLVNAISGDDAGEAAASEILGWRDTAIEFEGLRGDVPAAIDVPLWTLMHAGVGVSSDGRGDALESIDGVASATAGALAAGAHDGDGSAASAASPQDGLSALEAAMERLAARIEHADRALAAVREELASFREARRRDDAAAALREGRIKELEAFRDEVAQLAHEILGRVDGLFAPSPPEPRPGPPTPTKAGSDARSRRR